MHPHDANHDRREALHLELMGDNAFRVFLVGAVAFLVACLYVLGT